MTSVLSLRPSYYEALKRLTLELVGIKLGSNHAFLVETRLSELARKEGFTSLSDLIDELFSSGQSRLAIKVVSALLERDTHFNPDPDGMRQMSDYVFPKLAENFPAERSLRILSFGCSSGQEPFSIAIQVDKVADNYPNQQFDITAIDYPSPAMDRAKLGLYTHFEVQRGLPIRDLIAYFKPHGEDWVIKPDTRQLVKFQEHHLLSSLSDLGLFHLVVFRNGLPYYSSAAQIRVMRSLASIIHPGGFLMLGTQEDTPKFNFGFAAVPDHANLFVKNNAKTEGAEDDMLDQADTPPVQQFHHQPPQSV